MRDEKGRFIKGYKHTEEWKKQSSEKMKGKLRPHKRKLPTDEVMIELFINKSMHVGDIADKYNVTSCAVRRLLQRLNIYKPAKALSERHKKAIGLVMKDREIKWGHKTSKTLMGHEGQKGKDNYFYGKHLVPWNKGIPWSEEFRIKMQKAVKKGCDHSSWRGGISFEPYGLDWTKTLKKSIRERDSYTCQLCGKKQKKPRLDVHHIDYDKTNNDPINLISLCHPCHSKTNNNRKLWIKVFNSDAKLNICRSA